MMLPIVKGGKVYTQEEVLNHVPSEEEVEASMAKLIQQWEETMKEEVNQI